MADPFIGEIRMVGFNFAPSNWALCNGQLLPISQNSALFTILGTTYGGNGQTTFGLPNLQCRFPIHARQGPGLSPYVLGQVGGEASHTLSINEVPIHTHGLIASPDTTPANLTVNPANALPAISGNPGYAPAANTTLAPQCLGVAGTNQPHENRPPFLVINFVIALFGIYPSRN